MLASRVSEALGSAGHQVQAVGTLPAETDCDLIVCDLESCDPVEVAGLDRPSIGFYSHVDVDTRSRAVSAGIDLVVPRSRMARELPDLVDRVLGPG